ncbi:MAG: choice-of-anchor I family protein [Anaeroplasmataceae bacterium]
MKCKKRILTAIMASTMVLSMGMLSSCENSEETKIVDVSISDAGDVIVNYSNGTNKNIGNIKQNVTPGSDGKDGISIENVSINEFGNLVVTLSNGEIIDGGNIKEPNKLYLNKSAEFDTGLTSEDGGVAEIVKYNKDNSKVYLVNGKTQTLDIVKLGINQKNELKKELETVFDENTDRIDFNKIVSENSSDFEEGFSVGDITSVVVNTDSKYVAVALQHTDYDKSGAVVLIDYDGNYISSYKCGVQPDMITYNGNLILTADEGEPRNGYVDAVDPKGSVTIIDLTNGLTSGTSKIVDFTAFDDKRDDLVNSGVLIKKNTNPSLDLEPEYITTSGKYAYVSLQEANAIATLNLESKEFESVLPLGFKDHSKENNKIDILDDGIIKLENQNVYGVYMPDGIDAFTINGETYIATANEGDAREWASYSGIDKTNINGTKVETLNVNEWDGLDPTKTYILGGRSFSIFKASDMSMVYDSGDLIERSIALSPYSDYFNCSNNNTTLDSRSKKKGPEPESVLVREIDNRYYLFVGLERIGGIMTFDITDFTNGNVSLESYETTRDYSLGLSGDVAPEGLEFINSIDSPNGKNILVVANENSGTVSFYNIENTKVSYNMHKEYTEKIVKTTDHLIIYSAYGSGGNIDGAVSHNYIAIKNPTDEAIDLSEYKLQYATNGKTTTEWSSLELTGTIEAGEVFIIRGADANVTNAAFNISSYDLESNTLVLSNKAFSIMLVKNDDVIDSLGVDANNANAENYEGSPVIDISKQKIVIRKNDSDTDNNSLDYETISFKDLTIESDLVIEYLSKLGL